MLVVFDSKTGNVKRFVNKLNMNVMQITDDLLIDEPFVLITYTTGVGQVPEATQRFLERNSHHMQAVAVSGNTNWGMRYGLAGDQIAEQYEVPLMMKFELSGMKKDVERFIQEVDHIVHTTFQLDTA